MFQRLGHGISVDGPQGDFTLRLGTKPLLLAILQDALNRGAERRVTLLFGAREERDLYALEAIDELAT